MKRLFGYLALVAAGFTVAGTASAQGVYVEGGYKDQKMDTDFVDLNFGSLYGRFGGFLNKNFGGELEIGYGVKSDDIFGVDIKALTTGGIYGVAQANVSNNFAVFGRAGLAFQEIEADIPGDNFGSDNGFGYGVGAKLFFNDSIYLRGDYTRADVGDVSIDEIGFSLGLKY